MGLASEEGQTVKTDLQENFYPNCDLQSFEEHSYFLTRLSNLWGDDVLSLDPIIEDGNRSIDNANNLEEFCRDRSKGRAAFPQN